MLWGRAWVPLQISVLLMLVCGCGNVALLIAGTGSASMLLKKRVGCWDPGSHREEPCSVLFCSDGCHLLTQADPGLCKYRETA